MIRKLRYISRAANDIYRLARNLLLTRRPTYCHFLWDSVFIDTEATVYNCCHYRPAPIGNLYKSSLPEIWHNSIRLRFFRFLSLHRALYCFFRCTILTPEEKTCRSFSPVYMEHPKTVWILYSEFCNLRCIMCPQDHRSRQRLENRIIKEQIDWTQVEEIELQGGEILAMKQAKELYLWLTTSRNKKVNLITNGVLINDEWARYLIHGSQWIQISVNAATEATHEAVNKGSKFTRVISNIEKLIAVKRQEGSDVRIVFKYTIVPENIHEIPRAIELAEKLGCDEIAYGFDSPARDILRENIELRNRLTNQIGELVEGDLNVVVERTRLEYLNLM